MIRVGQAGMKETGPTWWPRMICFGPPNQPEFSNSGPAKSRRFRPASGNEADRGGGTGLFQAFLGPAKNGLGRGPTVAAHANSEEKDGRRRRPGRGLIQRVAQPLTERGRPRL